MKNFFLELKYLDSGAPFAFAYGPFFYFAILAIAKPAVELNIAQLMKHISIAVPFLIAFFALIFIAVDVNVYLWSYYMVLSIGQGVSLMSYALWGLFSKRARRIIRSPNVESRLMNLASIFLSIVALFFIIIAISRVFPHKTSKSQVGLFIIYGCIFIMLWLICNYLKKQLKAVEGKSLKLFAPEEFRPIAYHKSAVSEVLLAAYHLKLKNLMLNDEVYLDSTLNLEKLAQLLKIPSHHVSQLFNTYLQVNFNTYINELRINYACSLLSNSTSTTLENIALQSGFGSKSTFNRAFKGVKGVSPSQYQPKNQRLL